MWLMSLFGISAGARRRRRRAMFPHPLMLGGLSFGA
jgi:hypothetical protein